VDLRDLITKELEERSRMDPSLSSPGSLSSSSGINLFALLKPDSHPTSGGNNGDTSLSVRNRFNQNNNNRQDSSGGRFQSKKKTPLSFSVSTSSSTSSSNSRKKEDHENNKTKNDNHGHSHASSPTTPFYTKVPSFITSSSPASVTDDHRQSDINNEDSPGPTETEEDEDEDEKDDPIERKQETESPASPSPKTSGGDRMNPKITYVTHVDPPTTAKSSRPTRIRGGGYTKGVTSSTTESSITYTHFAENTGNGKRVIVANTKTPGDWSFRKKNESTDETEVNVPRVPASTLITKKRNPVLKEKGKHRATVLSTIHSTSTSTTRVPSNSTETIDLSARDRETIDINAKATVDPLSTSIDSSHDQNENDNNSVQDDFLDPGTAADGSHGHHIVNQNEGPGVPLRGTGSHNSTDATDISEPYRLTTERLAYILIGSCCAISVLCLIVVAFSIRCRDMCEEYKAWKKAEKLAVYSNLRYTTQQHAPLGPGHPGHLSRHVMRINGRTGAVETIHDPYSSDSSTRPLNANSRPIFGPSCCCCPAGVKSHSSGTGDSCPRGYFHPTPRGKLPFGAASSVHTFLPPRTVHVSNRGNNLSEGDEDADSMNGSMIEHPITVVGHNTDNSGNEGCTCNDPYVDVVKSNGQRSRNHHHNVNRKQTSRKINPSWIQSSIIVDELHRKSQQTNNNQRKASNKLITSSTNNNRHHFSNKILHNKNNGNTSYLRQQANRQKHHGRHNRSRQNPSNNTNFNRFNSNVVRPPDDQTRILWSGNDDRLI